MITEIHCIIKSQFKNGGNVSAHSVRDGDVIMNDGSQFEFRWSGAFHLGQGGWRTLFGGKFGAGRNVTDIQSTTAQID